MYPVNWVTAKVVENCPHHFIMEWEGANVPKGAKVGGLVVTEIKGNLLENPKTPLIGFFIVLDKPDSFNGKWRILVGSDHNTATNPDGSVCVNAPPHVLDELKNYTGSIVPRDEAVSGAITRRAGATQRTYAR
ncbi:MAG: hypothetical protein SFW65_02305 [Alphaproteobacteria bacterium]|nr:hypothetical protein [Alphaproteobacteria bacterium]